MIERARESAGVAVVMREFKDNCSLLKVSELNVCCAAAFQEHFLIIIIC